MAMPCFGKEMRQKEFTLKEGVTFINHGSYGVVPKRIQEAEQRIRDEMESFPDLWFRRNRQIKEGEARECIANFVNADPEDVVFVENATTGANTVLKSLKLGPEDIVLVNDNTYQAVKNTCESVVQSFVLEGVRTDYLKLKFPINSEEEVVDMYREYFQKNPNVKLAVIDHITSPSAIRMPIEKLITLCREFGVLSLIDGAHAPGQIPLNLKEIDADFYTGNLHKWLYCPRGCAILYVNKKHQNWIRPVVTSHGYQTTFQFDFFRQPTRDYSPYCVVPEAIKFYQDIGGYEKINSYVDDLLNKATDLMTSSWKTEKLPIPKSMEAPFMRMVLLPKLEGLSSFDDMQRLVVEKMLLQGIVPQITIVNNQVYIRLSANIYNEEQDYQTFCELVLSQASK